MIRKIKLFIYYYVLPNTYFHKLRFKWEMGYYPNIKHPKSFFEKMIWLLIYWRNPIAKICADKFKVRNYVKEKVGENYLIPIIGIYDNPNDINFDDLPNKFILKATHSSNKNIICQNKKYFEKDKAITLMKNWLSESLYKYSREWVYRNIPPRIICENLLEDKNGNIPIDYKFFCFNGNPQIVQVDIDRYGDHKRNFYDINWNLLDIEIEKKRYLKEIPQPIMLSTMLGISKKLSEDFPFVRVDLYNIESHIYFGELTFFPWSGVQFCERKYDLYLGGLLILPK